MGFTDSIVAPVEAADGTVTLTQTGYFANGAVASKSVSAISSNGMMASNSIDRNGDLLFETVQLDTTVLNADGSRARSIGIRACRSAFDSGFPGCLICNSLF